MMQQQTTITASDYQRLGELFDTLSPLTPGEQDDALEQLAATDPQLATLLHRMLMFNADDSEYWDMTEPIVRLDDALHDVDDDASFLLPASIGPYRVRSQIGWGSMGDVYLAEQAQPVQRLVAIKLLRLSRSENESQRYAVEAKALASLSHHNIAQIFDAGVTNDGRPYLVMEHVNGQPIDRVCTEHIPKREDRLRLFMDLCDAVHYAHQQGVIHRDLKPNNILVADVHKQTTVKVIDFGIARLTGQLADVHQSLTIHGQLLGTLAYMSPEQLQGTQIDTRSDVYALGVILHQLLTDELPYDFAGRSIAEVLHIAARQSPTARMMADRTLRGDLTTIVAKAMHQDPSQRYDSVHALRADIDRHLNFQPIEAQPPRRLYLFRKFLRRNRALSAVATFIAILIAGGVFMIESERREAVAARDNEQRQYEEARRLSSFFLRDVVDRLERVPGSAAIRHDLVNEILHQMREFLAHRPNDPHLLDDYARTLLALSSIQQVSLGDLTAARESIEEAKGIREHLLLLQPDDLQHHMHYALTITRLGDVLGAQGEDDARLKYYHDALEIHLHLVDLVADSRRYRDNLFWDYDRIANLKHSMRDPDAHAWAEKCLAAAEVLGQEHPEHYLTHFALARGHGVIATTHYYHARFEEASHHMHLSIMHIETLNTIYPNAWHFLKQKLNSTFIATRIAKATNDVEFGLRVAKLSFDAASLLHDAEPDNPNWALRMKDAEKIMDDWQNNQSDRTAQSAN